MVSQCRENNLELNTLKTVEMITDFRKNEPFPAGSGNNCQHSQIPQIPGDHHPAPEMDQKLHNQEGLEALVFSIEAEEVQSVTGTANVVLHRITPLLLHHFGLGLCYHTSNMHQCVV